jgi:hypothetical protein
LRLSIVSLICIFALIFAGCASSPSKLVLFDDESGKIFAQWTITPEAEFAIEFVHSVNKSPVKDIFRVKGKAIQPKETVFSAFGAGMQTDLAPGEKLVRNDDGTMSIIGFSQSYNELRYIVGTVSDHTLFINNEKISLRELCGKNAHILIRVR